MLKSVAVFSWSVPNQQWKAKSQIALVVSRIFPFHLTRHHHPKERPCWSIYTEWPITKPTRKFNKDNSTENFYIKGYKAVGAWSVSAVAVLSTCNFLIEDSAVMALAPFLWHVWISAGLSSDQQREVTSVLTDESSKGRDTVGLCCCNSTIFDGFIAILAWTRAGRRFRARQNPV